MRFRVSIRRELSHLNARQRFLLQQDGWKHCRRWKLLPWQIAVIAMLITPIILHLVGPLGSTLRMVGAGLPFAAFFVIIAIIVMMFRERRRAVQKLMRTDGILPACCFDCGYDLRMCQSSRCPECGCVLVGEVRG